MNTLSSTLSKSLRTFFAPRQRLAIVEACLIGLISALAAVLLKQSTGVLGSLRVQASTLLPAWIVLPAIGLSVGALCGFLLERLSPDSTGSGVPQVKAVLAQFPVPLDWRVAIVKLVTAILALSSGLTLGRQGPTVHIGAAVAAQLSRWLPTSPDHRRQMIAAGAGAGLAAGFNAPLAGIFFVVEELLRDVSSLTLGTAILAAFIGGVVSRLLGGHSLDLKLELSSLSSSFFAPEIPFYLLLGLSCGVFGALFTKGILISLDFYQRLHLSLSLRIGLAGLISGLVIAMMPVAFRDNSGLREFVITGEFGWRVTAVAFGVHFVLTLVAYGSGAPGGLFNPSLVLGSSLGYLVGTLQYHLLGMSMPSSYALVGMGAFFSAVSKAPVTAIAIVFEITTDFNLVLPLMLACVVSYLVSDQLVKGSLYSQLLEWKGYTLPKEGGNSKFLVGLTAADVMQRRVETLASEMSLESAVQAFSRSHHRGFPVVDDGILVGIITQTDIRFYNDRQLPLDIPLSRVMTTQPITVKPTASLSQVLYLLNRYQISRLPVTEDRKLIGIITRADIIRVEADQLSGEANLTKPTVEPSYVVYQTRAPATGKGRLLVPLANPQTAPALLRLAAAIARTSHYELECLQVLTVPRSVAPAQAQVKTAKAQRLLRQAEKLGKDWQIPVHTQIRVAHDTAPAILETIEERHINLLLMGWKGGTASPEWIRHAKSDRIFGDTVDTIVRQASCDVMLVKMGRGQEAPIEQGRTCPLPMTFNRWLVPLAGGPNSAQAIQLLPALIAASDRPEIKLCQIFYPSSLLPETTPLFKSAHFLSQRLSCPVTAIPVRSVAVADSVIQIAQTYHCDVVLLGASREGLLKQAIRGNIPEAIARGCDATVILVRSAI